jgi:hypothetical protein
MEALVYKDELAEKGVKESTFKKDTGFDISGNSKTTSYIKKDDSGKSYFDTAGAETYISNIDNASKNKEKLIESNT